MMDFTLKMMNFILRMMNFVLKLMSLQLLEDIAGTHAGNRESDAYMDKALEGNTKRAKETKAKVSGFTTGITTMAAVICRGQVAICIIIDELCIKNDELCI